MLTRAELDEAPVRFAQDVASMTDWRDGPMALAVSGGPDSLALLNLAATAFPGRVIAATVDHGLRPESRAEAEHVAAIAATVGVPHAILAPAWAEPPSANIQATARDARYSALADWAAAEGATLLATAHHIDDQAETVLMRLARGSGLSGLAGIRPVRPIGDGLRLIRPLLGWDKAELESMVAAVGWTPVRDPSNSNPDYDRTRARAMLTETPWLEPDRLAASASNLLSADHALTWTADRLFAERFRMEGDAALLAVTDVPGDLQRRLLILVLARFDVIDPPGPKLARLHVMLKLGRPATLGTIKAEPVGTDWRISLAPPRR